MDANWVHDTLLELATELQGRYGDREPTDAEVREFLRERLVAEGRSAEEIDDILSAL